MTREQVTEMRQALSAAAQYLSDADSLKYSFLFPQWAPETQYPEGFKCLYQNKLYKALQSHTGREGWEPDKSLNILFVEVVEERG